MKKTILIDPIGGQSERAWWGGCSPALKRTHYKFPPCVMVVEDETDNTNREEILRMARGRCVRDLEKQVRLIRGGERGTRYLLYQETIGALCATDYKWVQQEQVMQGKLIVYETDRDNSGPSDS